MSVPPLRATAHPLAPAAAAAYLGLDAKTLARWARQGYLPAHPLAEGKRKFWRFFESELSEWLSAKTNQLRPHDRHVLALTSRRCRLDPSHQCACKGDHPNVVQRYQKGSLSVVKRKSQPDVWAFRYYAEKAIAAHGNRLLRYEHQPSGSTRQTFSRLRNFRRCCWSFHKGNVSWSYWPEAPVYAGEMIALRWEDIDFQLRQTNVTHAIWHNVERDTKTEA